jgi:hypothetical protein
MRRIPMDKKGIRRVERQRRRGCDRWMIAYSEPSRAVIPTEAGHPFRLMAGTDSDLKAGSFSRFSE